MKRGEKLRRQKRKIARRRLRVVELQRIYRLNLDTADAGIFHGVQFPIQFRHATAGPNHHQRIMMRASSGGWRKPCLNWWITSAPSRPATVHMTQIDKQSGQDVDFSHLQIT